MAISPKSLDSALESLDAKVSAIGSRAGGYAAVIDRWHTDLAATLFHLHRDEPRGEPGPLIACILGGTGTGKSTVVNRLLEANISAASFRRTFTAGAVAITAQVPSMPKEWLGFPHTIAGASDLPARGQNDQLILVEATNDLLKNVILVDTPDLDGDQPAHHAQADRAFRWAEAVIFLVSPEKYQMTELLPYYRLARRYALPALFVMNKCETPEMLEDYRKLIETDEPATLFAIPRDDAAYEPPPEANLAALRAAIGSLSRASTEQRANGAAMRSIDLLGRLRDQITAPLRAQRRDANAAIASLRAMETPAPGVDVNPITEQLQRRLQQRSVLYLIGPGRVLDRLRQVPGFLVRLPRAAWEIVLSGKTDMKNLAGLNPLSQDRDLPNFNETLVDQFTIIQSRIDDAVRSIPAGQRWITDAASGYAGWRIDPKDAGRIADEELADLNTWLQRRWNATPRDTAILLKLLRYLPGGEKLTQWTEAAPYLLAIIVAAHHAIFGHVDLMILGGYSLATWLTERLSNEVSSRTRLTNRSIAARFEKLAHDQIRRTIEWVETQAPRAADLDAIDKVANDLEESLGGK